MAEMWIVDQSAPLEPTALLWLGQFLLNLLRYSGSIPRPQAMKTKPLQPGADSQICSMKKLALVLLWFIPVSVSCLAANPTFTVEASHSAGKVSPILYGLMTEEINHSY